MYMLKYIYTHICICIVYYIYRCSSDTSSDPSNLCTLPPAQMIKQREGSCSPNGCLYTGPAASTRKKGLYLILILILILRLILY